MQPISVREVAEALGWERDDAYHLIRTLLAAGAAEERGARRPKGGIGKGENVYVLAEDMQPAMKRLLERLRRTR